MGFSCGHAAPSADHPQVGTPGPLLQLLLIPEVCSKLRGRGLELSSGGEAAGCAPGLRGFCVFGFALELCWCHRRSPALGGLCVLGYQPAPRVCSGHRGLVLAPELAFVLWLDLGGDACGLLLCLAGSEKTSLWAQKSPGTVQGLCSEDAPCALDMGEQSCFASRENSGHPCLACGRRRLL